MAEFIISIIDGFIRPFITFYVYLIVGYVLMGWLVSFNVININNQNVRQIYYALEKISGFVLKPIQRILPSFGGLDFSPVIAIFGLVWLSDPVLRVWVPRFLMG